MIFCLRNSCVALLNRHEGKMDALSSVHNFKTFLRHAEIFFPFLRYFLTGAKIIPPWASLSRSNPKIRGISFTLLYGRFWDVWWDDLVNYFVSFLLFFHYWKIKKSLQWGVTQKYKLFKLLATSIALFSTSDIMKK